MIASSISHNDEEYNTTYWKELLNMCIVTLSMLNRCRHELATIEYCKKADKKVEEKDIANDKSGKLPKPRQACTESLGWLIYKTLDVRMIYRIDE